MTEQATKTMDPELLKILACPKCKGDLKFEQEKGLVCDSCRLIYEIRNGIPIMIIEEAKSF